MFKSLIAVWLLLFPFVVGAAERVLVIGDSISLGYTPFVQQSLKGVAEVDHSPGNAEDSSYGVQNIDAWIGKGKWDVITFNFGLWDICYRGPGPVTLQNRDKIHGRQAVPLDRYKANLRLLAERLKSTGAKVIFVTTTHVPDQEPGRFPKDVTAYNAAAKKIMRKEGIKVIDLNPVSDHLQQSFYQSTTDVHYTKDGYQVLAKTVTDGIREALRAAR